MGFSFNRISDFFVVIVVIVVQEVLHERGFSELRASRAKKIIYTTIRKVSKVVIFLVQEIFQHVCPPVFCLHQRYYGLLNQKSYLQVVIFF